MAALENYWPIEYQNISHEGSEGQFCLAGGCKAYVFSSLKFQFSMPRECLGSGAPSRSAQVPYVHVFLMNFFFNDHNILIVYNCIIPHS